MGRTIFTITATPASCASRVAEALAPVTSNRPRSRMKSQWARAVPAQRRHARMPRYAPATLSRLHYQWWVSETSTRPPRLHPTDLAPSASGRPRALRRQSSVVAALQDRIRIPGGFQLIAGGRYDALPRPHFPASLNTQESLGCRSSPSLTTVKRGHSKQLRRTALAWAQASCGR